MTTKSILWLGIAGVTIYLVSKVYAAPNTENSTPATSSMMPLILEGYRTEGVISPEDVGSTKILPIVSTTKTAITRDSSMSKNAKTEDVIKYNTASTATEKIKAAVKVLPKVQANELSSNLKKLGW